MSKWGQLRVLSGDPEGFVAHAAGQDAVAIVASWTPSRRESRSLSAYLHALAGLGFAPLVVDTSESERDLVWPHGLPEGSLVVTRPNIGYDFGSWAHVLESFPPLRSLSKVLLTNDSMVGPFEAMTEVGLALSASQADVFGLTESFQTRRHLQSFFMCFNRGILAEPPWVSFFHSVRNQADKAEVVLKYELGVVRTCERYGYSWEVLLPAESLGGGSGNPTFENWEELFRTGVPLVKRSLVTHPEYRATTREVAARVQEWYGQEVEAWLPGGQAGEETEP